MPSLGPRNTPARRDLASQRMEPTSLANALKKNDVLLKFGSCQQRGVNVDAGTISEIRYRLRGSLIEGCTASRACLLKFLPVRAAHMHFITVLFF